MIKTGALGPAIYSTVLLVSFLCTQEFPGILRTGLGDFSVHSLLHPSIGKGEDFEGERVLSMSGPRSDLWH